jgi:hypothetical protein
LSAGGGAGGGGRGGAGGAGGMLTSFPGGSKIPLSPGPHSVTIGGGASSPGGIDIGPNGSPSEFKSEQELLEAEVVLEKIQPLEEVQEDLAEVEHQIPQVELEQHLEEVEQAGEGNSGGPGGPSDYNGWRWAAVEKTLQEQLAQLALLPL